MDIILPMRIGMDILITMTECFLRYGGFFSSLETNFTGRVWLSTTVDNSGLYQFSYNIVGLFFVHDIWIYFTQFLNFLLSLH